MQSSQKNIVQHFREQKFSPKTTLHIVMWSLLWLLLVVVEIYFDGFPTKVTIKNVSLELALLQFLYYANAYFLIPQFLAKDKLIKYFSFLSLLTLGISALKITWQYVNTKGIHLQNANYWSDNLGRQFFEIFSAAVIFTIIKIVSDWVIQVRRKSELETRAFQSELNLLKSQINPHFLFNTLNSLYALTLKKSDEAPEIVLRLSEMMRYMLYECNTPFVPVSKEIDYIHNYLYLEKIRHAKIDVSFEIEGKADALEVAPLIFMAFIENAFKHGAGNHIHAGFISILLKAQGQELYLTVENSRAEQSPLSNHLLIKSGGVGLVNVKRRLQLLYPRKYTLKVDETPLTYSVQLWLDLTPQPLENILDEKFLLSQNNTSLNRLFKTKNYESYYR